MGGAALSVGLEVLGREVESPPPGGGGETAKSLVLPKGPRALGGIVAGRLVDDWKVVASLSLPPETLKNGFKITVLVVVKFVPVTVIEAEVDAAGDWTGAGDGATWVSAGNRARTGEGGETGG